VVSIHNGILCSHEEEQNVIMGGMGGKGGWGQEGEMTQVLYAHMNNKTIVKIKNQICPI
jgi:hypothetical protein